MLLHPFSNNFQGQVELLVACLGLIEARLREFVGTTILKGLIGVVEHLRGYCPVEVSHRSLEVTIIDVQIEVTREVSPGIFVDIKEFLCLAC